MQAIRLVKNSIIAIESPEAEVDDVDFVDDLEEVHDVVERFRRSEQQAAEAPAAQQHDRQQGNSFCTQTCPAQYTFEHSSNIGSAASMQDPTWEIQGSVDNRSSVCLSVSVVQGSMVNAMLSVGGDQAGPSSRAAPGQGDAAQHAEPEAGDTSAIDERNMTQPCMDCASSRGLSGNSCRG